MTLPTNTQSWNMFQQTRPLYRGVIPVPSAAAECELRNNVTDAIIYNTPLNAVEMGTPARDASGIAGTATEIFTEAGYYLSGNRSALRNGDYIYIRNQDNVNRDYTIVFREHKISTDTNTDLIIDAIWDDSDYVGYSQASFLVDRKIVVVCAHDNSDSPIMVADFATSTITNTGTIYYGIDCLTLLKSNGDTWIYVFGQDMDDNFIVMAKNYTQGTAWEIISLSFAAAAFSYSHPILVQDKYIVIFHSDAILGICADVIDLSDDSVSTTAYVAGEKAITNGTEGYTDEVAYVGGEEKIVQVTPSTLAIVNIYDFGASIYPYFYSDRANAYFIQYIVPNNTLFDLPGATLLGTFPVTQSAFSNLMDDDGTLWVIRWTAGVSPVFTLYHYAQDGSEIQSYVIALGLANAANYGMLLHAGDSFVLFILEVSGGSNWVHWYHIT